MKSIIYSCGVGVGGGGGGHCRAAVGKWNNYSRRDHNHEVVVKLICEAW